MNSKTIAFHSPDVIQILCLYRIILLVYRHAIQLSKQIYKASVDYSPAVAGCKQDKCRFCLMVAWAAVNIAQVGTTTIYKIVQSDESNSIKFVKICFVNT